MAEVYQGGCTCGALRYEVEKRPVALIACHCTECQRQSGSAFGMSLVLPKDAFRVTRGEPKTFTRKAQSGRDVHCGFCPDCGTRIYHDPVYLEGTINIKPGTLDDTSWLDPAAHVWTGSKQAWVPIPEGARCFEGQP